MPLPAASAELIEMKVSGIALDPHADSPIVLLRERRGERALPIWVGAIEAGAIAAELEELRADRPITHDLLHAAITQLGAAVEQVEVCDLRGDTFYARVVLRHDGGAVRLDARPSDAIALALRAGAPVYVTATVLARAATVDLRDLGARPGEALGDPERSRRLLERLDDEDFGKWKM